MKPPRSLNPLNECAACLEDFTSLTLFDRHRVGKHEYVFNLADEKTWDGRRCLAIAEMQEKGWTLDKRGRWTDPIRAAEVRKRFPARERPAPNTSCELAGSPLSPSEPPSVLR